MSEEEDRNRKITYHLLKMDVCPVCDASGAFIIQPIDHVTARVECQMCKRVWHVQPEFQVAWRVH